MGVFMNRSVKEEETLVDYLKRKTPTKDADELDHKNKKIFSSMKEAKVSYESLMDLSDTLKEVFDGIVKKS